MCLPLVKGPKVMGQLASQLFHGQVCVIPSLSQLQWADKRSRVHFKCAICIQNLLLSTVKMRSKELSLSVKQAIIRLKKQNKPIREKAKTLGVAKTTVWNILIDDVTADKSSRMNSEVFRAILSAHIQPNASVLIGRRFTVQMDNDPKHTAKATKEFLKGKKWTVMQWPSQSPDLNPIEHAFHLLKTKLKGKCPKNKQELKTVAVEAWQSITRDETQRLVMSMRSRLQTVIDCKGFATKY